MVGKLTKDSMASCSILPVIFNKSPYQTPNEALDRCIRARKGEDVRCQHYCRVNEFCSHFMNVTF